MSVEASPLHVALAVVVGVAFVGFVLGTSRGDYDDLSPRAEDASGPEPSVPRALAYRELREHPRTTPSGWEADLAALREAGPGLLDAVEPGTDRSSALDARAELRAYDGAPPTIPHAVRQDAVPECLACHEEGLRFRGFLAPAMSHAETTSCTQCHVVTESPVPGSAALRPDPRAVENDFDGLDAPGAGPRASIVAPPQLPHRVFMRENCDSCHGVNGRDPIRSSHPWRESCSQCHASSSDSFPGLAP